jgi:hypothetical protein
MDDNTVDRKFESIVLNEQIRVIDRELGYASGSAGLDFSTLDVFEKFLKPSSEPLPDIDMDYEDPQRNFTASRTDI